jgi:Gram-negative bacterial TonB protein C-terminal
VARSGIFENLEQGSSSFFFQISRGESLWSVAQDRIGSQSYDRPDVAACYEGEGDEAFVAQGVMEDLSDRVVLRLKMWRIPDRKQVFEDGVTVPMTDTMQALHSRLATNSQVPPLSGVEVRFSPEHELGDGEIPTAGTNGYSHPSCVDCTNVSYSGAAAKAKIQDTVYLSVVVGLDEAGDRIPVIRGLPCGLNQQVINPLRQWKFKPAMDEQGNPAAVQESIEMSFHLY